MLTFTCFERGICKTTIVSLFDAGYYEMLNGMDILVASAITVTAIAASLLNPNPSPPTAMPNHITFITSAQIPTPALSDYYY